MAVGLAEDKTRSTPDVLSLIEAVGRACIELASIAVTVEDNRGVSSWWCLPPMRLPHAGRVEGSGDEGQRPCADADVCAPGWRRAREHVQCD